MPERLTQAEVKRLRSLTQKKGREEQGLFLLEGRRAVEEALIADADIVMLVLAQAESASDNAAAQGFARKRKIPVRLVSRKELDQITSTVHAQGICAIVKKLDPAPLKFPHNRDCVVVAADAVADPGNLGSIIRSCDWFAADALLLGTGSVELYNEKVLRSTVGSIFHLPVREQVDLPPALEQCRRDGMQTVCLSGDGEESLDDFRFADRTVIVLGSEAHGVSDAVRHACDAVVRIPRFGKAESLNVGVACGITLALLRSREQ